MVLVDERTQRIRRVSVKEDIQLHKARRAEIRNVVVK